MDRISFGTFILTFVTVDLFFTKVSVGWTVISAKKAVGVDLRVAINDYGKFLAYQNAIIPLGEVFLCKYPFVDIAILFHCTDKRKSSEYN